MSSGSSYNIFSPLPLSSTLKPSDPNANSFRLFFLSRFVRICLAYIFTQRPSSWACPMQRLVESGWFYSFPSPFHLRSFSAARDFLSSRSSISRFCFSTYYRILYRVTSFYQTDILKLTMTPRAQLVVRIQLPRSS